MFPIFTSVSAVGGSDKKIKQGRRLLQLVNLQAELKGDVVAVISYTLPMGKYC